MPNPIVWHIRRVSWSETFGVNIESVGGKREGGKPGFQRIQRICQINWIWENQLDLGFNFLHEILLFYFSEVSFLLLFGGIQVQVDNEHLLV